MKLAHVNRALVVVVVLLSVALFAINAWAWVTCAPQHGGWSPWAGRVCYGQPISQ